MENNKIWKILGNQKCLNSSLSGQNVRICIFYYYYNLLLDQASTETADWTPALDSELLILATVFFSSDFSVGIWFATFS